MSVPPGRVSEMAHTSIGTTSLAACGLLLGYLTNKKPGAIQKSIHNLVNDRVVSPYRLGVSQSWTHRYKNLQVGVSVRMTGALHTTSSADNPLPKNWVLNSAANTLQVNQAYS
jgi:hypothetical protein